MAEQLSSANPYAPPAAHVEDVDVSAAGTLAGRGTRLGAAIVDLLIAMIAWGIVSVLTPLNIFRPDVGFASGVAYVALVTASGFAMFVAIHGYWLATQGQTIGKLATRIRIVRGDGSRASFVRIVFARYLPTAVLASIPLVGSIYALVDALLIFRDSRKCLHDTIADTVVVKA